MKTYKHLYDDSDEAIMTGICDATKGKLKHELLQDMKKNPGNYIPLVRKWLRTFYNAYHRKIEIYDGITRKKRSIVVPTDKEQVIHHMIVNMIKPVIQHGMYEHAYGSVPGRGAEKCAYYIEKAIRDDPKGTKYVLYMDIHQFFKSIRRKKLKAYLRRKIKDPMAILLLFVVIEYDKLGELLHFEKENHISELITQRRPTILWFKIQKMIAFDQIDEAIAVIRSLHCSCDQKEQMIGIIQSERTGIPLGFYTSQWLSQFYLEEFDHFIKEQLGIPYYWRYVDDMVLMSHSKRQLHKAQKAIETFINAKLYMEIKPNWQVYRRDYIDKDGKHKGRAIDFLGYRFFCDRTILRRSIMLKCTRKAKRISKKQHMTAYDARQMLSYLGRIEHSDTYGMYQQRVKPYVSIKRCKRKISASDKAKRKENRYALSG